MLNLLMFAPAISDVVHAGLAFNPRAVMPIDAIRGAVRALFDELDAAGVSYLLVGGVALLSYIEGRNTQDVDLRSTCCDRPARIDLLGSASKDRARAAKLPLFPLPTSVRS